MAALPPLASPRRSLSSKHQHTLAGPRERRRSPSLVAGDTQGGHLDATVAASVALAHLSVSVGSTDTCVFSKFSLIQIPENTETLQINRKSILIQKNTNEILKCS
jgi:hypothetical protein